MKITVGQWYQIGDGASFEVVAYDEEYGEVEVQYEDGTVEELTEEDWEESGPREVDSDPWGFGEGEEDEDDEREFVDYGSA